MPAIFAILRALERGQTRARAPVIIPDSTVARAGMWANHGQRDLRVLSWVATRPSGCAMTGHGPLV